MRGVERGKAVGGVRGLRAVEAGYVCVVAGLAVVGAARGSAAAYVISILLTLPLGVVATVLIYGGYAALKGVGGLWASTTTGDGGDAGWLSAGSAALNVTVLIAAALGNVLLLELGARRRTAARARRAVPPATRS
ncbi:hypothetical protein [Streptomyces sp. NBC_01190]|uniref:hypothetical protein n=1 Tax=Streptomyces sp. NBC_01190 TaxID=2903767 RepID=UPI00386ECB3E|nr:hypothetical protein OG519_01630 [Streptomyces sp. NBC_01190]